MLTPEQLDDEFMGVEMKLTEIRKAVFDALRETETAKDRLGERETSLIIAGAITGKNEGERKAQMFDMTKLERENLASAETGYQLSVSLLESLNTRYGVLKARLRCLELAMRVPSAE